MGMRNLTKLTPALTPHYYYYYTVDYEYIHSQPSHDVHGAEQYEILIISFNFFCTIRYNDLDGKEND